MQFNFEIDTAWCLEQLLKDIYNYISNYQNKITIHVISNKIRSEMIDFKTLEKQIKVFNYYYNKEIGRAHV